MNLAAIYFSTELTIPDWIVFGLWFVAAVWLAVVEIRDRDK